MCRSIKVLRNQEPPATVDDIRAAARQFVRKVSGYNKPSKANEAAFESAIDQIASSVDSLMSSLKSPYSVKATTEQTPSAQVQD